MAEKMNITYNFTFSVLDTVVTPAFLRLQSCDLSWGKWVNSPPLYMIVSGLGNSTTVQFEACGRLDSATGTQGSVVYQANDSEKTNFIFTFDIPYSGANSGGLTGSSSSYITDGGDVPTSGDSVTVNVTIYQISPSM